MLEILKGFQYVFAFTYNIQLLHFSNTKVFQSSEE